MKKLLNILGALGFAAVVATTGCGAPVEEGTADEDSVTQALDTAPGKAVCVTCPADSDAPGTEQCYMDGTGSNDGPAGNIRESWCRGALGKCYKDPYWWTKPGRTDMCNARPVATKAVVAEQ